MGTHYRRTNPNLARIGSTRVVSIPTSPATQVTLSSGYTALWISNVGPSTIAWGDAGVTASTGNLLFYSMNQKFDSLAPNFSVYLIADSVAGTVSIVEGIA